MWDRLRELHKATEGRHMLDLFAADPARATRFAVQSGDLRLDYAKTNIDDDTRAALLALCDRVGLAARPEAILGTRPEPAAGARSGPADLM